MHSFSWHLFQTSKPTAQFVGLPFLRFSISPNNPSLYDANEIFFRLRGYRLQRQTYQQLALSGFSFVCPKLHIRIIWNFIKR